MKSLNYILLVSGLIALGFFSCKKDKEVPPPVDLGYNYFPDAIGSYVIYEVDSTWQDDKSAVDTAYRYLLKEVIESSFIDNSGRPALRIERYKKIYNAAVPYDSMPWIGPKVWYANKTATTAEKIEENIRYIKLVFPAKESKEWDGNTFNTLGPKYYEIMSVDELGTVNSVSFDSVITVQQNKQIDFIQYVYEAEKYARNVGLIYKERDSLYDGGTADTVGYTYKQQIISYGK